MQSSVRQRPILRCLLNRMGNCSRSLFRLPQINSPAESSGIIAAYAQRLGITAPVLLDKSGRVAANYGIASYPATVLVDGNGTVREVWIGETGVDSLRSAITPLLAGALRAPAAQTAWMGRHV